LTSREPRLPRDRYGRDRERDLPIVPRRRQVFLRAERLLPGDDLAGIRRHPAHDRQECALRHVRTVVDRLARRMLAKSASCSAWKTSAGGPSWRQVAPASIRGPPARRLLFKAARPFMPSTWALISLAQPTCCRQVANSLAPPSYS